MDRLRGNRRRDDEGAVAVEAALLIPVIILMLFGIIEFAMVMRDYVALTSAARTGARTASAEPRTASFTQDAANSVARASTSMPGSTVQELWVYEVPTGNDGKPPATCSTRCVRYTANITAGKFTGFTQAGGSWDSSTVNACAGDPGVTSVGVAIKAQHNFFTKLFGAGMTMNERTVMRFEPMPMVSGVAAGFCKPVV